MKKKIEESLAEQEKERELAEKAKKEEVEEDFVEEKVVEGANPILLEGDESKYYDEKKRYR